MPPVEVLPWRGRRAHQRQPMRPPRPPPRSQRRRHPPSLDSSAEVNGNSPRAGVSLRNRPMWRIRLTHELPRYLLRGVAIVGIAASARFAIAPPRAIRELVPSRSVAEVDRAAEGYAVLFTRRYLDWNAAESQASTRALESFTGQGVEGNVGLNLPPTGAQHVLWAEVVQSREPGPDEHLYTVAAQTDSEGLLYLTVKVARNTSGALVLVGYPAFVGAPAAGPAAPTPRLREVGEAALATVVERALRNYLAGSSGELDADLTSGAQVSLPTLPLTLEAMKKLAWAPGEGS